MNEAQPSTGGMDVAYVARLARLHLSGEEIALFQGQLAQILAYMDKLRELDVEGIEPTAHPLPVENVLRADEPRPGLPPEAVLANAPRVQGGLFLVPRIIE